MKYGASWVLVVRVVIVTRKRKQDERELGSRNYWLLKMKESITENEKQQSTQKSSKKAASNRDSVASNITS